MHNEPVPKIDWIMISVLIAQKHNWHTSRCKALLTQCVTQTILLGGMDEIGESSTREVRKAELKGIMNYELDAKMQGCLRKL